MEFFVLRYAPYVVNGEFINIGILLRESEESKEGFCSLIFTSNWQRVQAFDRDADVELLNAILRDLKSKMSTSERTTVLQTMLDSFSNTIQLSEWKECVTDDPEEELAKLALRYL
jgi:hypothetical protein